MPQAQNRCAGWLMLILFLILGLQGCGSGGDSGKSVGGDPTAKIDATDNSSLQASLDRINASLNDEGRKKFVSDCGVLAIPPAPKGELLKKGLSKDALVQNQLQAFKALNGLNASEVAARADAVRAAMPKPKGKSKGGR